jgi:hypothetical protein
VHTTIFSSGPLNAIRFLPWAGGLGGLGAAGAAGDGTVRLFDVDTVGVGQGGTGATRAAGWVDWWGIAGCLACPCPVAPGPPAPPPHAPARPQAQQQLLLNLNPAGWSKDVRWEMVYGLDAAGGGAGHDASALLAGDSEGRLHVLDPRTGGSGGGASGGGASGGGAAVAVAQVHKPKTRVCSVAVQPHGAPRVLTAGAREAAGAPGGAAS